MFLTTKALPPPSRVVSFSPTARQAILKGKNIILLLPTADSARAAANSQSVHVPCCPLELCNCFAFPQHLSSPNSGICMMNPSCTHAHKTRPPFLFTVQRVTNTQTYISGKGKCTFCQPMAKDTH